MKRLIWLVAWVFVALSCVRELPEPVSVGDAFPEGEPLTIQFTVPGVRYVPQTRSEDAPLPLGEDTDLYSMHLAIFGSSGYLKEYVKATDPEYVGNVTYEDPDGVERTAPGYRFTVTVSMSSKPRTVHFIGNGPETLPFGYEYEVIPELLSKRNQQAFWQMKSASLKPKEENGEYVKVDGVYQPSDQTKADFKDIPLIRNWAKIEVSAAANSNFTLDGYALVNVPQYGTIAPYYVKENPGIDEDPHVFIPNYQNWTADELSSDFNYPAHLPDDTEFDYTIPAWPGGFVRDLTKPLYLYERPVPSANMKPSFVIVHGHYKNDDDTTENNDKDYFYKVDLMQDGVYYPIYRNFKYQIVIRKILSFGHTTAEAAAASAGSADVSADITTSHLADISDGEARLVVQPWMSHSFIRKQTNNKVLHVKFFDDMMSGQPNMDPSAVTLELLPMANSADDPVITEYFVGSPVYGLDTDKGWRTITFSTDEPSNKVRSQTLRVKGSYYTETTPPVLRQLYRDIVITLQPLQNMGLSCAWDEIDRGIGVSQQLYLHLPDDLIESMFPFDFIIEPEDMTLTPDNTMPNNNLPVISGTSISDHDGYADKTVYQFKRTLTWSEYNDPNIVWPSQDLSGNAERLLCCYFKTTRKGNATTIWVANEYFNKNRVSYSNPLLPELKYFHVEGVDNEGCVVSIKKDNLEYQLDDEGWKPYTKSAEIKVRKGNRVYFRGSQTNWSGTDVFSATGRFKLGGNITSLVVGDAFETQGADATGWTFQSFFKDETGLVDASRLILPMSTMSEYGYRYMFQGCTNLTAAPSLPAATLAQECYLSMFQGCTSLTTASALPATTLTANCYQSMFQGCTQLTAAPTLPATTLASNCYTSMFQGCTALTTAPKLLAETLVSDCYKNMFNGCSSLNEITMIARGTNISSYLTGWVTGVAPTGDFYAYVNSTLAVGNNGIPTGWVNRKDFYVEAVEAGTVKFDGTGLEYSKNWEDWTSEGINSISVAAGDIVRFRGVRSGGTISSTGNFNVAGNILSLAAEDYTSVTTGSFVGIFKDAEKLVSAADLVLPTTLQANCFNEMFSGCTSLTTPPTLSATTLAANCYKSMFSGCTSLTSAPALPATDLAANCYEAMFQNCTTLDATPTLPARTLAQECYKSMFAGCTNLTVSPQLPAETLVDGCYDNMFNGCSNLAKVYCSATTNLGIGFTTNWLANVAASGLFVKDESVTTWPQPSPSGIPDGWTIPWSGFKIRAITDNTKITFNYNYTDDGIEYSLNEGQTWIHYTTPFTLNAGQSACIKGNRTNYTNNGGDEYGTPSSKPIFTATTLCYISGNIMTLLSDQNNLSESAFHGAFSKGKNTAVNYIDIDPESPLILPATTLPSKCYMQMFRNCKSLTRAPVFRAEVVNYRSCYNMFRDCIGLTSAEGIELPAMTLAIDCYRELFRGCTSLTSAAPKLPAPTLVKECYRQMFSSTQITSLVCLATDISAENCTNEWMSGVTNNNSRTFYKASSMSVGDGGWSRDSHGIPSSWKVENYSGQ